MSNNKISLKEIAKRAGISAPLVSCILNGKGRASEEVRARVSKMLEEAGYRPKYTRKPILYVMDYPLNKVSIDDHMLRLMAGIQSLLIEEGCVLLVEFLPANSPSEAAIQAHLEQIARRNPGGVFVSSGQPWYRTALQVFGQAGIPLVQVGFDTEQPGCDAVVVDSFRGAHTAVRYLISQGHTRIATIRWHARHIFNSNLKYAGYLAALADAKIPVRPEYVANIDAHPYDKEWVLSRRLLDQMLTLPEPPTAVFVENSAIALSLLYPLDTDNGEFPEAIRKVAAVHFEDLSLDPVEDAVCHRLGFRPRESHFVVINWFAIGRMAARIMIDRISGFKSGEDRVVRISPGLQKVRGMDREDVPLPDNPRHPSRP